MDTQMLTSETSRFIVNNNGGSQHSGVIIDTLTDLMWTKKTVLYEPKTWMDSVKLNDSGGLYGYNDWRLPAIHELMSTLIDMLPNAILSLTAAGFENIVEGFYWSSSTYDNFHFLSLGVHIKCGTIDARNKFNNSFGYMWLTRGDVGNT